jgi:hypothetical protein
VPRTGATVAIVLPTLGLELGVNLAQVPPLFLDVLAVNRVAIDDQRVDPQRDVLESASSTPIGIPAMFRFNSTPVEPGAFQFGGRRAQVNGWTIG